MPIQSVVQLSSSINPSNNVLVLGRKEQVLRDNLADFLNISIDDWGKITDLLRKKTKVTSIQNTREIRVALLPEACSRHNAPSRAWAVTDLCQLVNGKDDWDIVIVTQEAHLSAVTTAVAKAFPLYSAKTDSLTKRTVNVVLYTNHPVQTDESLSNLISGVQFAASLFDRPTNDLNVSTFVQEALNITRDHPKVRSTVISGEQLREQGFGGLWAVGKAASDPPALVCLEWTPKQSTRHVAWIGKGIVYDTGGLSIKSKTGMPNMKGDMGGAAAVIGAFRTAVQNAVPYSITAVLCLAENSVGPDSTRPDDIVTLYSGKTVEINNTDAEGRLVLADGISWVSKTLRPDVLIDVATLTGAAPMSVGKNFAALYCNDEHLETLAVLAGRRCGECCHALPYVPEFFKTEFTSYVADMKNSVKDRANGQSACAGQFINNHLPNNDTPWLHIDIAGPAWNRQKRGTGYGVSLLLSIGAAE